MTKRGRLLAMSVVGLLLLAALGSPGIPAQAATPVFYSDRTSFQAALATMVTDGYGSPTPYPPGFGTYDDASFSAFLGETDYHTTGYGNNNIRQLGWNYCAGCNGSFELSFQTTSVTQRGTGVYGVGVDIVWNDDAAPYYAFITYGDGTTADIPLDVVEGGPPSFFGVTAPELIVSIHFGAEKGGYTTSGSFVIDNLTIGREYTSYLPLVLRGAAG